MGRGVIAAALQNSCPRCGAHAGAQCVGVRGQERARLHRERRSQRRPWGNPVQAWGGSAAAQRLTDEEREKRACRSAYRIADIFAEAAAPIWHWGDGDGGYVKQIIAAALEKRHGAPEPLAPKTYRKARIGRALSRAVFERDEYRCLHCGTHRDLTCDHIIPESRGGPTELSNLQTLCLPCNSRKGARE